MKKYRIWFIVLFAVLMTVSCNLSNTGQDLGENPTSTITYPTLVPATAIPTKTATPTETAVPTETPTPTATEPLPTPTEHGVTDPEGILPAGMPAIKDGYVMVVDKSGMTIDGDYIGFDIQLRIMGEESKLFRYNASTIRLSDNLGNQYDYLYNVGYSSRCTESDIYKAKQIQVEPGEKVIIDPQTSMMFSSYAWWCLDDMDDVIPGFTGLIPPEASSLLLEFEGFGPFSGFFYEFEL